MMPWEKHPMSVVHTGQQFCRTLSPLGPLTFKGTQVSFFPLRKVTYPESNVSISVRTSEGKGTAMKGFPLK